MAEINPAEVSSILREQLAGVKSAAELEEVGTVLQVGDGIARIYGLKTVKAGLLHKCGNPCFSWRLSPCPRRKDRGGQVGSARLEGKAVQT